MADTALSVTSTLTRGANGGLPERLVQAGLMDEATVMEAILRVAASTTAGVEAAAAAAVGVCGHILEGERVGGEGEKRSWLGGD